MKDLNKSYLFAGLTILFWGTSASAFKIGLKYTDYIQLLFFSIFTAVLILFIILIFQNKLHLLKNQTKTDYFNSAFIGFLNPFLYYTVLFKAYSLLPAQIAQPLNFIWPITLVLLSIPILKQSLKLKSFLALLISFAGVFLISSEGQIFNFNLSSPLGVFLALGSSIVWSLFWLFNMKDKRDEVVKLFLNFFFALIFISILALYQNAFESFSKNGFLASIYIGFFEMGITFVLWLKALQFAGRTDKISNLVYLTPFFSLLFIHFVLHEKIYLTTIFGLILIILGILIQNRKSKFENENI
ncbi:MAG: hypothetical protein A2041_01245 [Bacteroidetes bacterium GWA2_31_9b]|nr:MAG: hypothetical protein A2041_01245 [Bacteroidetes bacterium GWA2_31_9b]